MKILFLIPPVKNKIPERIYGCSYQLYSEPELPILYAAALLLQSGHEVDSRDFTLEGNSQELFEKFLENFPYQAFIFHTVLLSKEIDLEVAKRVRKNLPTAFLIFFGPEPTRMPEGFLFDAKCFVVRGEPEIIFKNLIKALENNSRLEMVKGISYFKNNKIIHNPTFGIIEDLDKLPFPARNLVKKYEDEFYNTKIPAKPHTIILTSRGCSFRCYFCVPNSISWARELEWKKYHSGQKPPLKLRSAENIIEEFKEIAKTGYKSVWVMDDMFLWGKERTLKILKEIKDLNLEIGILARADFVDKENVKALKEANCKIVDMGVESFDQEILDYIQKDLQAPKIYQAINFLQKEGIVPEINLMFGVSPLETKEKIKETINKAIKLNVKYVLFSIATPFPGTKLQEVAEKEGWIVKEKYENLVKNLDPSSKSLLKFPYLSDKDLENLEKYAKIKFYFRPSYIWWRIRQIKSFSELIMLIKTALKILK